MPSSTGSETRRTHGSRGRSRGYSRDRSPQGKVSRHRRRSSRHGGASRSRPARDPAGPTYTTSHQGRVPCQAGDQARLDGSPYRRATHASHSRSPRRSSWPSVRSPRREGTEHLSSRSGLVSHLQAHLVTTAVTGSLAQRPISADSPHCSLTCKAAQHSASPAVLHRWMVVSIAMIRLAIATSSSLPTTRLVGIIYLMHVHPLRATVPHAGAQLPPPLGPPTVSSARNACRTPLLMVFRFLAGWQEILVESFNIRGTF